jgi:hypothetical protein
MELKIKGDISRATWALSRLRMMDEWTRKKITAWAASTVEHIKRQASGPLLGTRTAHLKRNTGMRVVTSASGFGVVIGTGEHIGEAEVKYASIQEHGGTIKPKNKKFLAIPLPGTKGVPANFPDAFVIKSKAGNLLIVQRKWRKVSGGENSKLTNNLTPLFVLKKEVTIKATHLLTKPINDRLPLLNEIMSPGVLASDLLEAGPGTGGAWD